jgi:tetratricopeptide (TPR) repeat protein
VEERVLGPTPVDPTAARLEAEALRSRALALLEKGEFETAVGVYDEALGIAKSSGDAPLVDWMFVCRAAAQAEIGEFGALTNDELLELKRILLRATDPQTAFRAAYTSAGLYELRKDRQKAEFYNRIARQRASQITEPLLVTMSENQLGNLLAADSRFEEASQAYTRALAADGVSPVFRAITRDNLGYCLIALDRSAEGLEMVHEAFTFLERENARAYTVLPLMDLCFGYLKVDRFAEARYFGEEGLQRAPLLDDASVDKNFLYLLGESCHLGGDTAAAQGYFDRLAALYPEFRNLRAYLEVFDFRNVINLRSS